MHFGAGQNGMAYGPSSSFNVAFVRTRKKTEIGCLEWHYTFLSCVRLLHSHHCPRRQEGQTKDKE